MLLRFPSATLQRGSIQAKARKPAPVVAIDVERERLARRNALVESHIHLVPPIAVRIARHVPPSFELDDLIGAGQVGLITAADKYDPARRSQSANTLPAMPFEAFARPRIRGAILDSVRRRKWADHTMAPLEAAPEPTMAAVIDISIDRERRLAKVRAAVAVLPDRLRDVVQISYSPGEPDLKRVAEVLEIGTSHASHLKSKAIAEIRQELKRHAA